MDNLMELPKPFFALAPMDDVTDTVFRQMVAALAPPDVYYTEFVNADGLQSPGRPKLLKKLFFTPLERPIVAQIWGKQPENFYKTARQVADGTFARELGLPKGVNFAGVDLNMGCPQKSEVQNGTCSALMNDRPLATDIIKAAQEGLDGRLPLSVKTRTGFNQADTSWIEFLLDHGLQALIIHGRTKAQKSQVPADWKFIGWARSLRDQVSPATLIVGNGDVMTRRQGLELARRHKLDGIMIGRGVFNDPFIFARTASPWTKYSATQRLALYEKHVRLFAKTWRAGERPIQTLNKFCKIYVNGFKNAKELRESLMAAKSPEELIKQLQKAKRFV